ncbi:SGNH/GDSL hydrolase family protein [Pantoea stewartii]|uniref:SGNH/GDSL hydrolase family protein n=1 Tax=Pantoea stewartii TaxID=66269 RepID=UPI00197CE1AB|nr:SGNH/GDSL hydrolase family protein [Pantoea stewartii]
MDRQSLIPYMREYEEKFTDSGLVRWLPYLMYFHPTSHVSPVVNTDSFGFRYTEKDKRNFSVAEHNSAPGYKLLAGSSTVFGIGASQDRWTLSSRMSERDPDGARWINFGGRSFNSTQELQLLTLYHQHLPKIDEIVLFSGFNNLGLARQPAAMRGDNGAFFNCHTFFEALESKNGRGLRWPFQNKPQAVSESVPGMEQQIAFASELTLNHLTVWQAMANMLGAKITYILQPLSGWVRDKGSVEEEIIFAELDEIGGFSQQYGDILKYEVCEEYARQLQEGAAKLDIPFINSSPLIRNAIKEDEWMFVDRIHFTDYGHDKVSKIILDSI